MVRFLVLLFMTGFTLHASGQEYMFQINDFKATKNNLSLEGSCQLQDDRIRLTSDQPNQSGACWYKTKKIKFKDGFESEFTFLISNPGGTAAPGDGFAFVIQAQSTQITGGTGDNIGYKQIPYGVALEFDTKDDSEGSRNHINLSYYNPETKSYRRYATVHEIPEITDGKPHFTRIIYRDGRLEIYLDSYLFPVLSVKLDIAEKINSPDHTAWLGFTASTSNLHSNQDLLGWSIKEFVPVPQDIKPDSVKVAEKGSIEVKKRKLTINVWDNNTVDGDVISLKLGPEWILTKYQLTADKYQIQATLIGFSEDLVLYAHNVGMVPPNTIAVSIYDGVSTQRFNLESDMETSESLKIVFTGDDSE
ncbi:MAG TPA: L-type lectin-domain containing protein [Saprospiraceae bacterium]|nr:L-type lectin-domain containing protein [Saprospiraceae bacterium]